jgi:hypothetical protein
MEIQTVVILLLLAFIAGMLTGVAISRPNIVR